MEPARLLDFEIQIEPARSDGLYPVEILRAPGGEAAGTFDPSTLPPSGAHPGAPPATVQEARTLGAALFEALFRDEVRSRFDVSLDLAAAQQAGLRLRLRIEPPELASLPWELLFDARSDEFVALSRSTPIVRYLAVASPVEPLTVEPPLRVLALAAGPADLPPVDRDAEHARLQEAIMRLQKRRAVELVWLEGQSVRDLQVALQDGPFHILHYVGHARWNPVGGEDGAGQGEIVLAGEDGLAQPLGTDEFTGLLRDHRSLRLVVLNACEGARSDEAQPFASLAAALVQSGLPGVVAMQSEITTAAAGEFTRAFYAALAAGLPVDPALSEARKAMRGQAPASLEWATPVLYLRAVDGALWETKPVRRPLWAYLAAASASALLLLGLWALIYWIVVPWLFPTQMDRTLNIAIAEVGLLGEDGQMHPSEFGNSISQTIYDELARMYGDDSDVEIWHDSQGRAVKNVRFGAIDGATADARAGNAEELANRINATFVVYGYLTSLPEGEALTLEFYSDDARRAGEPQATAGGQTFGAPIDSRVRFDDSAQGALADIRGRLDTRLMALYWLTRGLLLNLINRPDEAWQVLNEGRASLEGGRWGLRDGKDVYLVHEAQAALYSGRDEEALAALGEVLAGQPDYVKALLIKGGVLLDRAQRFFLRGRDLTDEQLFCMGTANPDDDIPTPEQVVANAAPDLESAARDAHEAVALLEQAAAAAPASDWPPIESQVRMDLGLAYRVRGTVAIVENRLADAEADFAASVEEFGHALALLDAKTQPQYVGWTQAGLGATRRLQAALRTRQVTEAEQANDLAAAAARQGESIEFLRAAVDSYDACIDQREATRANLVFQRRVLQCACVEGRDEAATVLASTEAAGATPVPAEGASESAAQGETP